MELVAGYPFFLIKNGLLHSYPKLLESKKCEAVIIGGGISGALTAYYLTESGIECILVDGRSIGLGSTCASTSLLQYELDIPLHQLKKKIGEYKAVRAYQVCGDAIDKLIAIMNKISFKKFRKTKSLFFSQHGKQKKFIHEEYKARREAGFDVDFFESNEMKTQYGLEATYGILSEKGATNDAYAFTHELLQHSMHKGLQVFDRTSIKSIEYKDNKVLLKTNEGCLITANHLINATGYEVINFIEKKIVDLDCTYAIISEQQTEKNDQLNGKIIMWNTDDPYLYMCFTGDGRIMIGGRDESFVNMKTMHACIDKKTSLLEKDFLKAFPHQTIKTEFAWSGVFGKTRDSLPYIGKYPATPNAYYALGFGGNGITFSLVAAEIITDLLLERKNKGADLFSFNR